MYSILQIFRCVVYPRKGGRQDMNENIKPEHCAKSRCTETTSVLQFNFVRSQVVATDKTIL